MAGLIAWFWPNKQRSEELERVRWTRCLHSNVMCEMNAVLPLLKDSLAGSAAGYPTITLREALDCLKKNNYGQLDLNWQVYRLKLLLSGVRCRELHPHLQVCETCGLTFPIEFMHSENELRSLSPWGTKSHLNSCSSCRFAKRISAS